MNRLHHVILDLMIASDTICTIGRKLKELKPKAYIDNIGKKQLSKMSYFVLGNWPSPIRAFASCESSLMLQVDGVLRISHCCCSSFLSLANAPTCTHTHTHNSLVLPYSFLCLDVQCLSRTWTWLQLQRSTFSATMSVSKNGWSKKTGQSKFIFKLNGRGIIKSR